MGFDTAKIVRYYVVARLFLKSAVVLFRQIEGARSVRGIMANTSSLLDSLLSEKNYNRQFRPGFGGKFPLSHLVFPTPLSLPSRAPDFVDDSSGGEISFRLTAIA